MTPDKKRAILEAAAKACGIDGGYKTLHYFDGEETGICSVNHPTWNPIDNSIDTSSMCARLNINTFFYTSLPRVECNADYSNAREERVARYSVRYDGTPEGKEAAWRLAATMVAAKIGGYTE